MRARSIAVAPIALLLACHGHTAPPGTCGDGGAADHGDGGVVALPAPTGPYAVGRHRYRLVDPVRDEPNTPDPDDHRALGIEVFYPTAAAPCGAAPGPYLTAAEASGVPGASNGAWAASIGGHARDDAPFLSSSAPRPVLLFSPGYASDVREYSAILEQLASEGYVVVGISHTYWTPTTVFPDGTTIASTHGLVPADDASGDAEIAIWIADAKTTLDALATWNAADPDGVLTRHLALDEVGYFGHSFGGATAINVLAQDTRVLAAADLDGTVYGPSRASGGPTVGAPVLFFLSQRGGDPTISAVVAGATGPAIMLTLDGARHLDFGDFPFFASSAGIAYGPLLIGTIDPRRAIAATNAYLEAFFAGALGAKDSPLLHAASTEWPEVEFTRRN